MKSLAEMEILAPNHWKNNELIDSGNGEKLERFGKYTLCRPEPQAVWSPHLAPEEWERLADARFQQKGSASGQWDKKDKRMPDQWLSLIHI